MIKVAVLGILLCTLSCSAELNSKMQLSVASFSLDLMKEMVQRESRDVFVSPLSIYSLLAILQHGAHENTHKILENVLHASAVDTREAFYNITTSIEDSDSLESLRFWSYGKMKDFHTFSSTVEDILDKDYISRFNEHQLPYYKEGNISIRTGIALSDKASKENFFDLVNLLAFYGLWSHRGLTHKNITFNPKPDEKVKVRAVTMRKICPSGNSSDLGAKWVHLPLAIKKPCICRNKPTAEEYWSTRNITLLLVVPTEKHGLQKLIERLTPEHIVNFINYSSSPDDWEAVQVTLPPFNINASINFIPYLQKLGLGDVFGKSSDLSGFSSHQELYVTEAVQTGQFIVDEYGARTKLYSDFHFPTAFRDLGEENSTLNSFLLDEPFLFFVVDEVNMIPLLMGRVTRPVARNWNPFHERELRMKKLSP